MRVLFLSTGRSDRSSNQIVIDGLRANGVEVHAQDLEQSLLAWMRGISKLRATIATVDWIFVGYDCPGLVSFVHCLTLKPIAYNALCSVYERFVISRKLAGRVSPKAFWYWAQDFFACWSARLILVETQAQVNFFQKLFFVSARRVKRHWTGANEQTFFIEPGIQKNSTFTVVFRGRLLPEAGIEVVLDAAKLLESDDIRFRLLINGRGLPEAQQRIAELQLKNIELETSYLEPTELRRAMSKCHISLGQLSNHPRLVRTIPHKAFESLALGIPYLTATTPGILELLTPGETCIGCEPANAAEVAEKIRWAKAQPEALVRITASATNLYTEKLRPQVLGAELVSWLR